MIVLAVTSVMLALATWTRQSTTREPVAADSRMTFSFSATVPPSPANPRTLVNSPKPLLRKLVESEEVKYIYRGRPGTVAVVAELSTASGWRATVPLQRAIRFNHTRFAGTVPLRPNRWEALAQSAAEATGIPVTQLNIAIVARVTTRDGESFAPRLSLTLTRLRIMLAGDPSSLVATDSRQGEQSASVERTAHLLGQQMSASTLRIVSSSLTFGGLFAVCILGWTRRFTPHPLVRRSPV